LQPSASKADALSNCATRPYRHYHVPRSFPVRYPVVMANLIEIEVKIAVASAARARAILRDHGFRVKSPRVFEQNLVLDNARGGVKASGLLLRIRTSGKRKP